MARLESISIGGYYATPPHLVPLIAAMLQRQPEGEHTYVDPCAGEGAAVLSLIQAIHGEDGDKQANLCTIEMEKGRHTALVKAVEECHWKWKAQALFGDAFRADWELDQGASLLWLNPPYDLDPKHKRLEERFLVRFAPVLAPGGVLVFLVPYYALSASAETLARSFDRIECYRFPDGDFEGFKQVVLLATKRTDALFQPDPELVARVQAWASGASSIPVLGTVSSSFSLPPMGKYGSGFRRWGLAPLDIQGILKEVRPWSTSDKAGRLHRIPGILPEGTVENYLVRQYPVAMPPRSAHIAAGIAAGIFNGFRIEPDHSNKLPPLLVKGVFDKEYRTIEEKQDKHGNIKSVVQVQQPKLVTTVLDTRTSTYTTIKPSAEVTGTKVVADMTMADLLAEYGRGLMHVMLKQCPVLHDPARDAIELPELQRPLFRAQAHASQAAFKLLGGPGIPRRKRRFKSAFVLGEIGSGKTSCSLAVARAIGSKRTLVMCPPHLLDSWVEQIEAVTPWVPTVILSDVKDVQDLAARSPKFPVIAIMSREVAKLGHGIEAVSGACPSCGTLVDPGVDHAKKRSRCAAKPLVKDGVLGELVESLALALMPVFPGHSWIRQVLVSRPLQSSMARLALKVKDEFPSGAWDKAKPTLRRIALALAEREEDKAWEALQSLLLAYPDPSLLAEVATVLYHRGLKEEHNYSHDTAAYHAVQILLLADDPFIEEAVAQLKPLWPEKKGYYGSSPWNEWTSKRDVIWRGAESGYYYHEGLHLKEDKRLWGNRELGDPAVAVQAIGALAATAFKQGPECGEILFQAVPEPRRYPLATYIARRHPDLFDLFIADEVHEVATDGSAQERAAHRLMALGIPTLLMTGTVMNGYAESLFTNMWYASPGFRAEFARDERPWFVTRYGYRKRILEDKDTVTGEIIAFGSQTDRVERRERIVGKAPGVLPLFLFQHLLPISVTLHKADLTIDIPDCEEVVETALPGDELLDRFNRLKGALLRQIKADRFKPDVAGKLWGALAEIPSYLDLATGDTGNREDGSYVIAYPENVPEVGGQVIAVQEPLPTTTVLPKERWLIERVRTSLEEGRNVLVFAWHTALLPRLARLLKKELGIECPILDPGKVPTRTRQAWIDREVVKNKRRVLVVNPVTIQTGLNNLVYFSDEVWHENPGCNPTVVRQAIGRVDRIGQKERTRIFFPLYEGTAQVQLHSLLLHKIAVAKSTDGLDAESAMLAAGIGEDSGLSSFAVGRQLYEMLTERAKGSAFAKEFNHLEL